MRVLFLILAFLVGSEAHKILVYNMKFAHSHSNFLGNIADILVDAGHDVVSYNSFIFLILLATFAKNNQKRVKNTSRPFSFPRSMWIWKTAPAKQKSCEFHLMKKQPLSLPSLMQVGIFSEKIKINKFVNLKKYPGEVDMFQFSEMNPLIPFLVSFWSVLWALIDMHDTNSVDV